MGLGVQNLGLRVWGVGSGFSRAHGILCQTLIDHSALNQIFSNVISEPSKLSTNWLCQLQIFRKSRLYNIARQRLCSILLRVHLDYNPKRWRVFFSKVWLDPPLVSL